MKKHYYFVLFCFSPPKGNNSRSNRISLGSERASDCLFFECSEHLECSRDLTWRARAHHLAPELVEVRQYLLVVREQHVLETLEHPLEPMRTIGRGVLGRRSRSRCRSGRRSVRLRLDLLVYCCCCCCRSCC